MMKSLRITVFIIGIITVGSGFYSMINGRQDSMSYFAMFIGIALIATVFYLKNSTDSQR